MITFAELKSFVELRDPLARRLLASIFRSSGYGTELVEEMVSEAIGILWAHLVRRYDRGMLVDDDACVELWKGCVAYSARHAKAGRRTAGYGGIKPKDVYDAIHTGKIQPERTHVRELLGNQDSIPDVVAMLIDYPAFLKTLNSRQVAMLEEFVSGSSTNEVAVKFEVSAGTVSQFRARLVKLWHEFQNDSV